MSLSQKFFPTHAKAIEIIKSEFGDQCVYAVNQMREELLSFDEVADQYGDIARLATQRYADLMGGFYPIKKNIGTRLIEVLAEKCALHVLLESPNLPICYVVFDGDKYWFFNPNLGWNSRKEFKGAIDYLRVLPWYVSATLNLPFKIREIEYQQSPIWLDYQKSINS